MDSMNRPGSISKQPMDLPDLAPRYKHQRIQDRYYYCQGRQQYINRSFFRNVGYTEYNWEQHKSIPWSAEEKCCTEDNSIVWNEIGTIA